jgi:hypothetical protein
LKTTNISSLEAQRSLSGGLLAEIFIADHEDGDKGLEIVLLVKSVKDYVAHGREMVEKDFEKDEVLVSCIF